MNITFLIGNGFDLHPGPQTRYTVFWSGCALPAARLLTRFQDVPQRDLERRAAAEMAFGRYAEPRFDRGEEAAV